MKKALILVLALTLTLSLAVPAAAGIASSVAKTESDSATAPLPFLIETDSENYQLYMTQDASTLPEEAQESFAAAQQALKAAVPEGLQARYFFYYYTDEPCTAIFRLSNIQKLVVQQFLKGEWIELESTINNDGTITVKGLSNGPVAFFVA